MLKHQVSYKDFDNKSVKETLWFNLTPRDSAKLTIKYGDLAAYVKKIEKEKDAAAMMVLIEDLVLTAYGERSEDGRHFVRNDEIREQFSYSLAFETLLGDLYSDEKKMSKFFDALLKPLVASAGK